MISAFLFRMNSHCGHRPIKTWVLSSPGPCVVYGRSSEYRQTTIISIIHRDRTQVNRTLPRPGSLPAPFGRHHAGRAARRQLGSAWWRFCDASRRRQSRKRVTSWQTRHALHAGDGTGTARHRLPPPRRRCLSYCSVVAGTAVERARPEPHSPGFSRENWFGAAVFCCYRN